MKQFNVWFRVGKDFKENFEAEEVYDAERKWGDKVAEQFHLYVKDLADDPEAVIYDIAEERVSTNDGATYYHRDGVTGPEEVPDE